MNNKNILSVVRDLLKGLPYYAEIQMDLNTVYRAKLKDCWVFELNGGLFFSDAPDRYVVEGNNFYIPVAAIEEAHELLSNLEYHGVTKKDIKISGGIFLPLKRDYLYSFKHPVLDKRLIGRCSSDTDNGPCWATEMFMFKDMDKAIEMIAGYVKSWKDNY